MLHTLGVAPSVILLAAGWLVFEEANIWPTNADRVVMLRTLFALGAGSCLFTLCTTRSRLAPALYVAGAYVAIAMTANTPQPPAAAVAYVVIVVLLAAVGTFLPRPFWQR